MTKDRIEQLYDVEVIALVGTNKYLTLDKREEMVENTKGHNCVKTVIYYGEVIVDDYGVTNYKCINCNSYLYDMETKEIMKLC